MNPAIRIAAAALALCFAAPISFAQDPPVADATRGEKLYARCQGCHSIDRNRIGPLHRGLFGRKAGSAAGFDYSDAMKQSGIVWDEASLDVFLAAPRKAVPGTRMTYAGIKDPQERADLIAYLREATR